MFTDIYDFFVNRVIIKTTMTIMAITINIPAPIPTLKIPSTTEQPERENNMDKINNSLIDLFCIIFDN